MLFKKKRLHVCIFTFYCVKVRVSVKRLFLQQQKCRSYPFQSKWLKFPTNYDFQLFVLF